MTAENKNVEIWSGDSHVLTITVNDGAATPVAIDITGFTVWWHVSRQNSAGKFGSTATLTKDNDGGSGIALTDPTNGKFTVTLLPADTAALSGDYYHEAQVKDLSGNISTVMIGKLTIARDLITLS